MNNPPSHNPDPDSLQNPSGGTAGFIFGTYSIAEEDSPKDKVLIQPNQGGYAYVSYPIGGTSSILSFEDTPEGGRVSPPKNRGGGIRGTITGFSQASRLRFLRFLASIDYAAFEGKLFFVTLTYPDVWPEDPRVCKGHLESFLKDSRKEFGEVAAVWRLGIQERGAWHFHLILFLPSTIGPIRELRRFVATSWYEACGKISEGHLLAGPNVEEIESPRSADYVGRYLAKKEKFPEGLETGRVWGYWNKKLLPIRWETTTVSLADAYTIRRLFRRLQRRKGTVPLRKVQVFVKHENLIRLLEFLQGRDEHPRGARRPLPRRRPRPQGTSVSNRNEEN